MLPMDDSTSLSRLFHLNSEPWLNLEAYESEGYHVQHKHVGEIAAAITLPPLRLPAGMLALLMARSSCRTYEDSSLPINLVAEIVGGAFGCTRMIRLPIGIEMQARAAPSAGGLYPLELYAACRNVTGLENRLYHYNVRDHTMEPMHPNVSDDALRGILVAEPFVRNANVILFLSAVFDRTQHKYGPRGYRYVLLEAGHVAQNVCLLAIERGLGSLCIGGFMDGATNRFLEVDGVEEAVVYAIALGWPALGNSANV
jgi:SagB-type dehydrogenase family enzyme